MARIRAIKPEFWSSPNHPADPWARLLYIAMWNWADDAGVGTANLRELAGFAFPNEDQIDVGAMRRLCADIAAHYGAQFYTVGARPYFAIPTWRDHQKFDSRRGGKHPGPDHAETWLYQQEHEESAQCADSAPDSRRSYGAGTEEQGNIGTGEQGNSGGVVAADPALPIPADADSAPKRATTKRGTRIPDSFMPAPHVVDAMRQERPDVDLESEHRKFIDYWTAQPGSKGTKLDWNATWRNWIRNSRPSGNVHRDPTRSGWDELKTSTARQIGA